MDVTFTTVLYQPDWNRTGAIVRDVLGSLEACGLTGEYLIVDNSPAPTMEAIRLAAEDQPCWTRDEVDDILTAAQPPHRDPLVFLAETGARVGEAKWLAWSDIDFEHRIIHIRPKEGWRPKSGDERVVPMSDRLYQLLQSMSRGGRWVFTARVTSRHPQAGRQISARRLLQYLKRVLKRLGLPGHLHTFRHSFISFVAYEGVSERVLRKWIGHVDRDVLDWYFHLADRQSQEAMQQLSEAARRKKSTKRTDSNSAQSQHKPRRDENGKSAK